MYLIAKYFHKSFKQIKFILSKLYAEELDLLYKVYGENLNDFNYNDLSEKEQKIFAYELVPILERLIINPYLTREIPDWINDLRLKSNQDSQDWVKIINLYKAGKSVDDIANMTGINKIVIDNIISKIAVNNKLVRKK